MKRFKIVLAIMALALLIVGVEAVLPAETRPQPADASDTVSECPAGSYNIGISKDGSPICKLEPTGCPYGDSIPMDMCDKFKPEVEPLQPIEQPVIEPVKPIECGGK